MNRFVSRTAVVIGAGIAGLAAARALAGFFEKVIVIERDTQTTSGSARRGVPQGRQPHLLLCGGFSALSALFPNLRRNLQAAGALPLSAGRDLRIEAPGIGTLPQRSFGLGIFSMTRPLLESVLLKEIAAVPNIELRHGLRAHEALTTIEGACIIGLLCEDRDGSAKTLRADLVVDASGRGAFTRSCLTAGGHELPRETAIGVDIGYQTVEVTLPAGLDLGFKGVITRAAAPDGVRSGYMLQLGKTHWQVLLVGRDNDQPPADFEALRDFAVSLPTPTIARALKSARAPRCLARYRFTQSVWRHFGGLDFMPRGLLPLGDAIARFNPVYGQGMTVAAQQAVLLRDVLAEHARRPEPLQSLATDFLAQAESLIALPWSLSALPDLVYPQTVGERPANLGELLRQQEEGFRKAMHDVEAHRALLERQHLVIQREVPKAKRRVAAR